MKKHINIPVFIPHLGCPNQCVFCNQKTISGVSEFNTDALDEIISQALSTVSEETEAEIAFFGGSFTGIDRDLMIRLLSIADKYVKRGAVSSIRCSTRPDYIDEEILSILKKYSVKVIELGLQNINEDVLKISKRNHTFADAHLACKLIVENGFELVGQMMIGLPGSTEKTELETADFIIKSGARAARIYPTVVFRDTELCSMTAKSIYKPLSVEDAVTRSASILMKFVESGIEVIRIGLCASENLGAEDTYVAGPNHPALGELVENRVYYNITKKELLALSLKPDECVTVMVAPGALSKAIGQNKKNKIQLIEEFSLKKLSFVEDDNICAYSVKAERNERNDKCI